MFDEIPIPGATVAACHDGDCLDTVTDAQGRYRFVELTPGDWTVQVRMRGFVSMTRTVAMTPDHGVSTWRLTLQSVDEVVSELASLEDADHLVSPRREPLADMPPPFLGGDERDLAFGVRDALTISGSTNNGLVSASGQPPVFGNNRPTRSVYTGMVSLLGGHSALDARPFSFTDSRLPRPRYGDVDVVAAFGGPFRVPGTTRSGYLFASAERAIVRRVQTQSAVVPTLRERRGDFSHTRNAAGDLVRLTDAATGQRFPTAVIPSERISPQAAALLALYPTPNVDTAGRYNYQASVVMANRRLGAETRVQQGLDERNDVSGTFAYRQTATDALTLFGFEDSREQRDTKASARWSHRVPRLLWLNLDYRFARLTSVATPHFANVTNVSGNAGIAGNNQEPVNWGPPTLQFSSGMATLTDSEYQRAEDVTHAWAADVGLSSRGRHTLTFGAGSSRRRIGRVAQRDPRGRFLFTGSVAGWDVADFLLGSPHASAVAFGPADTTLTAAAYHAYLNDDWRVADGLTVTAGVRWEYATPMTEQFNRLVNLDLAPGFTAAAPVVGSDPVGVVTGRRYSPALIRSDRLGFQPRVGLAWRPVHDSSLVIRASYRMYRDASGYESLATLMTQQPPLATTVSIERSETYPLTLYNGFPESTDATNTFAVDPDLRVGIAQIWEASMVYHLPNALTVMTTYTGTRGSRLMRQSLPNSVPPGASNPCPSCPTGYVYVTADGRSSRHAGHVELRRRLRNGWSASIGYTLAKAVDDGVTFGGPSLDGTNIAQDWRNLDAEYGPSSFDQRHVLTTEFQRNGRIGAFLGGWTFTGRLRVGSGLPLTPIYFLVVPGTAVSGVVRADLTGVSAEPQDPQFHVNPAAYRQPAPGQWGTAGRHSITGPTQVTLDGSVGRTFAWGERLTFDWRLDASNVLNTVTYARVNMRVSSPQFGLPNLVHPMRQVRTSLRVGF